MSAKVCLLAACALVLAYLFIICLTKSKIIINLLCTLHICYCAIVSALKCAPSSTLLCMNKRLPLPCNAAPPAACQLLCCYVVCVVDFVVAFACLHAFATGNLSLCLIAISLPLLMSSAFCIVQ